MSPVVISQPPMRVEPCGQDKKTEALQRYAFPGLSSPNSLQRKVNPISRSKHGNSR